MAQDYATPGAALKALRDDVSAQLSGQGVDVTKPAVELPKAGNFVWSCESLQQVATGFYHGCSDAITAGDIPHAAQYYQFAQMVQQAHDAQCTSPTP